MVKSMMMVLAEVCGWIGALLVLVAYYLVSTRRVSGDSLLFQLGNISGAGFLIFYTYYCGAYASVLVNSIWVLIGLRSLVPYLKKREQVISEYAQVASAQVLDQAANIAQEALASATPSASPATVSTVDQPA